MAALGSLPLRAPSLPATPVAVATATGCRLALEAAGPACPCAGLSGRQRLLLGYPVPLNRASARDLEPLPGLGPARAAAIVAARAQSGPFARADDLARVRGIGAATVERLRPLLLVDGPDPACGGPGEPLPRRGP